MSEKEQIILAQIDEGGSVYRMAHGVLDMNDLRNE